jgi:hypothetical protein
MFPTFKWIYTVATNEWNQSYDSLDERIDQLLKLSSISILTVVLSPLLVSYDIGYELGNQYIACSRQPTNKPEEEENVPLRPVITLRRSARLAAKRLTIS